MVLALNCGYDNEEDTKIDRELDHPCIGCKYKNDPVGCLAQYACGNRQRKSGVS